MVGGRFRLQDGGDVGFEIDAHDPGRTLVIDPKLGSSTYLGGDDTDDGEEVVHDDSGNAYVAGWTCSTNFPTARVGEAGALNCDAFVARFNKKGKLDVSTIIGGEENDTARTIYYAGSVGRAGARAGPVVAVAGFTNSPDFPLVDSLQSATTADDTDVWVAQLDADLETMDFSSLLGGREFEFPNDVMIDADGYLFLTGSTESPDFPTENPTQKKLSGTTDAFLAMIDPGLTNGSSLMHSTYHGGNGDDSGYGVTGDDPAGTSRISDWVEVTGITDSSKKFPLESALQDSLGGGFDAFLAKWCGMSGDEPSLVYSSYYGGSDDDFAHDMARDSAGRNAIALETHSDDLPLTSNAPQPLYGGSGDAGLAVFDITSLTRTAPTRSVATLYFATYLGDVDLDYANAVAVDRNDLAYLAGGSNSPGLDTVKPLQAYKGGTDVLLAKIDYGADTRLPARVPAFLFVTHFGGNDTDIANGVTVDRSLKMYVTGFTTSTNFKLKKAAQKKNAGGFDAFYLVVKK